MFYFLHFYTIIILVLLPNTAAISTFTPNCTLPESTVTFVSSLPVRGSSDLIWTCFLAIVTCTWTIQHLNVPLQRRDSDPGLLGDLIWGAYYVFNKAKWMLVNILLPELLFGIAIGQLVAALEVRGRLMAMAKVDGVDWSLQHAFFANMGGFVLRLEALNPDSPEAKDDFEIEMNDSTLGAWLAQKGRPDGPLYKTLVVQYPTVSNLVRPISNECPIKIPAKQLEHESSTFRTLHYHTTSSTLYNLRELDILPTLPSLPSANLADLSKSDPLSKLLSTVQLVAVITQVSFRLIHHLPVSHLELSTAAFGLLAILTFLAYLHKPKDVSCAVTITLPPLTRMQRRRVHGICLQHRPTGYFMSLWRFREEYYEFGLVDDVPLCNDSLEPTRFSAWGIAFGLLVGGSSFGALHMLGDHFMFASYLEQVFWPWLVVATTALPALLFLSFLVVEYRVFKSHTGEDLIRVLWLCFVIGPYLMARILIWIMIVRGVGSLDTRVWLTTPADWIPSFR